ncbi:lpr-7 [Pristionchus pacificus]|uniref:Lpr-7 n=1 Tax=Pristionchus pacificus TaxID=54126 RepID=A0A2A6D2W0_PRIPA|nr:lpr-7 [Pristionchus pacificus]|eukprot:PDM84729.1 lpr-7 [Pristionchus pacificus]
MRLFVLLFTIQSLVDSQLLEVFGLANGNTGTVQRQPFQDIASQSVGLLNYLASVQKNPDNKLAKRLKQPIPQVAFVDGLPVIPGVVGSLPGAGACLPRNSPLVRERRVSPSFFQNIVRNIPGAQDYLSSFLPQPVVNVNSLYGKYHWAIDTPSVHEKFCPTTEFLPATTTKSKASFSLVDKFRTQDENGGDKTAFGYGLVNHNVTYVYFQDDPCPYQVVMIGPIDKKSGQYEYVILSNWARFPIIGLVRDIRVFYEKYKDAMEAELEKDGFMNGYSTQNTIHYTDWSKCRRSTPVTYFRNVLSELFG